MSDKICVVNGRFIYFHDDGELDVYYIILKIKPVKNEIVSYFH